MSTGELRQDDAPAQLAEALGGGGRGAEDDEAALAARLRGGSAVELRQELRRRVAALTSSEQALPPPTDALRLGDAGYPQRWYRAKLEPTEAAEGRRGAA